MARRDERDGPVGAAATGRAGDRIAYDRLVSTFLVTLTHGDQRLEPREVVGDKVVFGVDLAKSEEVDAPHVAVSIVKDGEIVFITTLDHILFIEEKYGASTVATQ